MNYIEWNKKIWDYFFLDELKNTDHKIVIAVNEGIIKEIGKDLLNPIDDFIQAINIGPQEVHEEIGRFSTSKTDLDFLSKAKYFIENPNYFSQFRTNISRWERKECLITAYIAYLVLMVTDENQYWADVNTLLYTKTKSNTQN